MAAYIDNQQEAIMLPYHPYFKSFEYKDATGTGNIEQ